MKKMKKMKKGKAVEGGRKERIVKPAGELVKVYIKGQADYDRPS